MSTSRTKAAGPKATVVEEESPNMLASLLADARYDPEDTETYEVVERGFEAFLNNIFSSPTINRIDAMAIDNLIADIDKKLSAQINAILHNEQFQKLESAWRELKYLVDHIDFRENIEVEILNSTKEELLEDFEMSSEIVRSSLYNHVYSSEYGVAGGHPYGFICSTYDFGPGHQDLTLLQNCASIAAMSHAPFLSNASPEMYDCNDFSEFAQLSTDLADIYKGPKFTKWRSFRQSEDSRYVGLCMPRFLLRQPYGEETVPVSSFNFEEEVVGSHNNYLWGKASVALSTRIADSFARYRWCPNFIGPNAGGLVEDLPLHHFEEMGELQTKCPTEILLTERRGYELSEQGFIGLEFYKRTDRACFFAAASARKPTTFGLSEEGKAAEANERLGAQLPYLFITTRLAHYLKVMQREQIGSWKERSDLERELNKWIGQYVVNQDNVAPSIRSRRPLRQAKITVEDVEGQPGWYKCGLEVRPHFKYAGAFFTLSLVGKLDKD